MTGKKDFFNRQALFALLFLQWEAWHDLNWRNAKYITNSFYRKFLSLEI